MKKLLSYMKCTFIFLMLALCFTLISCQKGENEITGESSKSENDNTNSQDTNQNASENSNTESDNPDNTYTIKHEKDGSTYKVTVTYDADSNSTLCLYNIESNELLQSIPVGKISKRITFKDVNLDGYMDIVTNTGGTLNETHELYIWNVSSCSFIKVTFENFDMLSYFEVHEGYIKNWLKDTASSGVVEKLV